MNLFEAIDNTVGKLTQGAKHVKVDGTVENSDFEVTVVETKKQYNKMYDEAKAWLTKLYDFINEKFFENALSIPVVTMHADDRKKYAGWFVCKEVWKEDSKDKGETELNICATSLDRPAIDIAETMLHEMCHQYAYVNKIQDCSRSGTYHNKLFAKIGEKHGLSVTKAATIGYAVTALTEESKQVLTPFCENVKLIYRLPLTKGIRVKSSSTRKYVCPCCQQSVRATKTVNIMCLDCNQAMQEDD